jgi:hypothetical protein
MAHFAELDAHNIVTRVVVICNDEIIDLEGHECEELGLERCCELFGIGTCWKQTSYHGNFRKNYAGIGYTYDASLDAFIAPQPYPSWTINTETCRWVAPTPMPTDGYYTWSEDLRRWVRLN